MFSSEGRGIILEFNNTEFKSIFLQPTSSDF